MEIRKIKGAKSLAYEVVDEKGVVWARVLALPLAEKVADLVTEVKGNAQKVIDSLR